ncbi:hypothetical protein JCGZ_06143 [Jatropha curcas]|uniref:Uncharacterized protein n=1 Tax=Jatropha curcas TaxID=180498 RepID=A0A067KLQ9_JATCU|nr:formin-like protein 14 [Jatropha curcas]KDP37087.1 hypothetical protein JCGZ_06143 [Jatropha curcas]
MAILSPPPATTTTSTTYARPQSFPKFNPLNLQSHPSLLFPINPSRPFLPPRPNPNARLRSLYSALSPQPPTQPDPPPEKDPVRPKGIAATFSRFQDRVQIFLAVLFWMSLFFWASASGGRNGDSGRPNKGSRFRR